MKRVLFLALLGILLGGCDDPVVTEEPQRRIGLIAGVTLDDPFLEIPDTVRAGDPFLVKIKTYGPSYCWRMGDTEVEVDGLDATVTPYDWDWTEELGACLDGVREFVHGASLQFRELGTGVVTIRGRDVEIGGVREFRTEVQVIPGRQWK